MTKRILVSLIPITVVSLLLFGDFWFAYQYGLIFLVSVVAAGSVYEIIEMYGKSSFFTSLFPSLMAGASVCWIALYLTRSYPFQYLFNCSSCAQGLHPEGLLMVPLFILCTATVLMGLRGSNPDHYREVLFGGGVTMFVTIVFGSAFVLFRAGITPIQGNWLVLFLLLNNMLSDSAAYFAGTFLGSHSLSPDLSPNKTLEGLFGAIIAGGLIGVGMAFWTPVGGILGNISAIVISLILSVTGAAGDLLGSMLKRGAGVEHSSPLFPQIGGFLDMADSFFVSMPASTILFFSGINLI